MNIPDYAIIRTPTLVERMELFEFLQYHGYHWARGGDTLTQSPEWDQYEDQSACNIYPDKHICHWNVNNYLDPTYRENPWWPRDERFILCSVADFIAMCNDVEPCEEEALDCTFLDSLL